MALLVVGSLIFSCSLLKIQQCPQRVNEWLTIVRYNRFSPTKKWRLSTGEDALVLRLNVQANFPEQRLAQAGLQSHPQPAGWVHFGSFDGPFRVFCEACHGKFFYLGFLLFLEQQGAHKYNSLTKNQVHTTLPSTTSDRPRAQVKRKNVCKSNCMMGWLELEHWYIDI